MITVDTLKLVSDFAQTVLDDPEPDQFLSHITNKILGSLEARGTILGIIERQGFLDLVGTYGYPKDMVEPFQRIPLWTPMPITDAARTGEINIFKSSSDLVRVYPHLKEFESPEPVVTVSAPITYRNTVIGAIGFTSIKAPQEGFLDSETTKAVLALCGLYIRNILSKKIEEDKDYLQSIEILTQRQKEIIKLFKEELTTDEIAERLNFSSSTIKQDIIKIYSVFGVNSRGTVVELAKKVGIA